MFRKCFIWALTLSLLLSSVGGLSLVAAAEGEGFAFATYVSGDPLYINATENLYTPQVTATPMAAITGNEDDRYAAYMSHHNDQVGIHIPENSGMGPNVTVEVCFWADTDNRAETRLGVSYTAAAGQTDYTGILMKGTPGGETVYVDTDAVAAVGAVTYAADGWGTLVLRISDADFNWYGQLNLVKWSHDNNATEDGWYIESVLVYDTDRGRPTEEQLFIRENTVGYVDFAEGESHLLTYTSAEAVGEWEGEPVFAIGHGKGYDLTVTAEEALHPAVTPGDTHVTLLLEARKDLSDSGRWEVLRYDYTDNNGTTFPVGALFETGEQVLIRKIVLCRTELAQPPEYKEAFVDLDDPISLYPYIPRVTTTDMGITWWVANGTAAVSEVAGKQALPSQAGEMCLDVEDDFTRYGENAVADLCIRVTYMDAGTGALELYYDAVPLEWGESPAVHSVKLADLTDSGQWKTATVYVDDACLRNGQSGADMRIPLNAAITALSVTIGSDKYELYQWINKPLNPAAYPADVWEAYELAKSHAQQVADNQYATKAQVEAAIELLVSVIESVPMPGPIPYEPPQYDWDTNTGYGMEIRFPESGGPTYGEFDGLGGVVLMHDMYIDVDDAIIPETQRFIRIDITHKNGCDLQVDYNALVPEGVDTSVEPYLSYYNYRDSNGLHRIEDGQNVGNNTAEYSNPLGVIRSVSPDNFDWMTTSIYLTDAQFRNACQGSDFCLRTFGGAIITKIAVYPCDEADIPAVGDATRLREVYEELAKAYNGDFGTNTELEAAFKAAGDFLTYNYRTSQEEIDAMLNTLYTAGPRDIPGDVDGDGAITSTDARLVLQYYAGKIPAEAITLYLADVDGDEIITSTDARLILQRYSGKITAWP